MKSKGKRVDITPGYRQKTSSQHPCQPPKKEYNGLKMSMLHNEKTTLFGILRPSSGILHGDGNAFCLIAANCELHGHRPIRVADCKNPGP